MWLYEQSTGRLSRDGKEIGRGYSGCGEGKNNPDAQDRRNVGPIPAGTWRIGPPFHSTEHGPYCLGLTPAVTTQTYGRSGFLIHGDSRSHPGEASRGCVILAPGIREAIWESGDREMIVIGGGDL